MWYLTGRLWLILSVGLAGCAGLVPDDPAASGTSHSRTSQTQRYSTPELSILFGQDDHRELSQSEVAPDQVLRLLPSEALKRNHPNEQVREAEVIVGVVDALEPDHIRLRDVLLMRGAVDRKSPAIPLAGQQAAGVNVVPMPGTVRLRRDEILSAAELSLEQITSLSVTTLNAEVQQPLVPPSH